MAVDGKDRRQQIFLGWATMARLSDFRFSRLALLWQNRRFGEPIRIPESIFQ
jgi:hypothetical protein